MDRPKSQAKAQKQTIAVDIDDVLAASAEGFVAFSNKRWGTKLTPEIYDEHWSRMWGIDHAETLERAQIIYTSDVVSNFRRFNEADAVLAQLAKRYKLVIITSRNRMVEKETRDWVAQHYNGVFDEVHMPGFYDGLKENGHLLTKADLCKQIGVDFLIDDHPKHCLATAKEGMEALLFGEYAWNQSVGRLPKGVTRVKDWQAVKEYFKRETKR